MFDVGKCKIDFLIDILSMLKGLDFFPMNKKNLFGT